MAKLENINDDMVLSIAKVAKEYFCDGIYVPCDESHPCKWDFISFSCIELNVEKDDIDHVLNYRFDIIDISNSIYERHEYSRLTLKEILKKTDGRYAFEISGVDW